MPSHTSYACVFRWNWLVVDLARGTFGQCCKTPLEAIPQNVLNGTAPISSLMNSNGAVESRRAMLAGQKDSACTACWKMEDAGVPSMREFWSGHQRFLNSPYAVAENRFALQSLGPEIVEIMIDDICNLECIYCNATRSTRWQARTGKMLPRREDSVFVENFWKWLTESRRHIRQLTISGGEPILSPRFNSVVDRAIQFMAASEQQIALATITNLQYSSQVLSHALEKMRPIIGRNRAFVSCSNESTGKTSETVRTGLKWKTYAERFDQLLRESEEIEVATILTLNATALPGLADYLEFVEERMYVCGKSVFPVINYVAYSDIHDPLRLGPSALAHVDRALAVSDRVARSGWHGELYWGDLSRFLRSFRAALESKAAPTAGSFHNHY